MNKVDIVILWVNPDDYLWRAQYNKYAEKEGKKSFEPIRFRDYGTLNYLFRGIEKNASWVNKVHLILASESQVPDWLDTSHEKLKVHYHREFISANLLPTFNSNCIELFLHNIADLSEYYILFNDDQFITSHLEEDMFVKDDLPVFDGNTKKLKFRLEIANTFRNTLDNNRKFVMNYCYDNKLKFKQYKHAHLPEIHVKSFEKKVIKSNLALFLLSLIDSRWRCDKNFTNWLFSDLLQSRGAYYKNKDLYIDSVYMKLSTQLTYDKIADKKLVCINDDLQDDFDLSVKKLKQILKTIYPDKSSFEK